MAASMSFQKSEFTSFPRYLKKKSHKFNTQIKFDIHEYETMSDQILPYAACPQLFHIGEPQEDQSSCHRNSILLQK